MTIMALVLFIVASVAIMLCFHLLFRSVKLSKELECRRDWHEELEKKLNRVIDELKKDRDRLMAECSQAKAKKEELVELLTEVMSQQVIERIKLCSG